MNWIAFSYSLPAKRASSARVSLWRCLQRSGAVTRKAGVYVLPAQDDCTEAFQWLAQEVQEMGGDAVVMRVDRFEALPMNLTDYRHARWVTRLRPHVDRVACAWLIRRFINPTAEIRYATRAEAGEVGFDMRDAVFGHRENRCTFETMMAASDLKEPGLQEMAEIAHEIDLRDGR